MRKKDGFYLCVFLNYREDQDPIYVWIESDTTESAIVEAWEIMETIIGWNDYFLGKYRDGYLDQAVRM